MDAHPAAYTSAAGRHVAVHLLAQPVHDFGRGVQACASSSIVIFSQFYNQTKIQDSSLASIAFGIPEAVSLDIAVSQTSCMQVRESAEEVDDNPPEDDRRDSFPIACLVVDGVLNRRIGYWLDDHHHCLIAVVIPKDVSLFRAIVP
jgi:hypothetical protein